MKMIALASIAGLALAAGFTAQAAPTLSSFEADTTVSVYQDQAVVGHSYDRCHGRASGTADPACGSSTGGPSGGLF